MLKRYVLLIVLALCAVFTPRSYTQTQEQSLQASEKQYANNQCVICHSALQEPVLVSSRFFEWQFSRHWSKSVSCEACHGGDSASADKVKAHAGIVPHTNVQSRLNFKNQPETCGRCHQNVADTFVQSTHYRRLKGIGLAASCTTCHEHMATQVIYSPQALADQCARCHDTLNLMPARPEIPAYAGNTLAAFNRANSMLHWASLLLANAEQRNLNIATERAEWQNAQAALNRAKVEWHAFKLDGELRRRIDAAYNQAMKVRDELRKKLNMR